MDTSVKILHEGKDLNPRKEVCGEKPVNCLLHLLSIAAVAGALGKVFSPEATGISQGISNVLLPMSGKIINFTENSIAVQVADVPSQPLLHQIKAREQNLSVMNWGVHKESGVLASLGICEEVGEGFVEDTDGVDHLVRNEENGMEWA